jgi:hypothetical protein
MGLQHGVDGFYGPDAGKVKKVLDFWYLTVLLEASTEEGRL